MPAKCRLMARPQRAKGLVLDKMDIGLAWENVYHL